VHRHSDRRCCQAHRRTASRRPGRNDATSLFGAYTNENSPSACYVQRPPRRPKSPHGWREEGGVGRRLTATT
jgi:hypothetical protein